MTQMFNSKVGLQVPSAAPSQKCRVVVGSSMPRQLRVKVQANALRVSVPKRKLSTVADSSNHERVVSPTGKVAVGPWQGPYATLETATDLPTTLYLDNCGSAHLSLDDNYPPSTADSTTSSDLKIMRSTQQLDSTRRVNGRAPRREKWSRTRGANAVKLTHQIYQARPRSMN